MTTSSVLLKSATATRGDALEFASRTLKNIQALEAAFERGEPVHVVTHMVNSLLGLIVFPLEKTFVRFLHKQRLDDLVAQGWPSWGFDLEQSSTLGDLVYHLRNAVAHGRISFTSDSRNPSEVTLDVADARPKTQEVYWRASIGMTDLRHFCVRYASLLEDVIG